jgi:hypothetical protein
MAAIWNACISGLNELASVLGVPGTIMLVAIVLGFVLYFVYMILLFGDRAVQMFLPFLSEAFKALRSESTKTHPAIRLEMRFQQFLGAIVVLCLLGVLLHALVPWVPEKPENVILGSLLTSGVLFVCLGSISLRLTLRLNK